MLELHGFNITKQAISSILFNDRERHISVFHNSLQAAIENLEVRDLQVMAESECVMALDSWTLTCESNHKAGNKKPENSNSYVIFKKELNV